MRLLCIFALVLYWNSRSKAAPSIESPVITKITEGEPVGSVLVTVKATTTRGNLTYDIVSPTNAKTWFTINNTGTISVKKEPDREDSAFGSGGAMIMEVYVSDSDGGTKGTVYCTVIDVNDNVPQFTNLPNVINITEDTKVSSEVFTVLATDKDFGSYSRITYGITSGNEDGMFQIDIANGVISTVKSLDFEKRTRYTLSISATDECENCSLSNSSTLVITVQDADDLPANFSQTLYQANIDKDSRTDSSVIKVYAEDLDSFKAPVTYGIHPGSNIDNFFAINTNSGQITVNKPLVEGKYTLVVTAKSTDQPEAFAIVQVTVGSTNVTYEASVAENRANIFVFNLKVIQRQFNMSNATFVIISGNNGNLFVANNNTKNLTLGSTPLDRELKSFHVLIVKAQEGEKEGIAKLTVTVADKNDNKPVFQSAAPSFSVSVREDITEVGTTIATVHATDRDEGQNGLIVYDILDGNNQGKFLIENRTGVITLAKTLDRETTDQYVLNISATDSGSPPLASTVQLNVSVLDANDNSPVLTNSNPMEIEIAEDATPGTLVTTVIAQDKDVLENSRIVYSIISGADGKFLIDSRTGAITTTSPLDREMQDVFKLKVRARDNGTFPRSVMAYVTVKVTDINDNKPVFSPESYTGVVYVNSLLGSIIATVQATDKDTGVNGKLVYEIVSGNDENLFYVDETSGVIRTSAPFDEKNKEKFTIGLRVSDAGTPKMTATTEATASVFVASSDESVVLYAGVKPEFALKNKEQLADVLSNLSGGKSFIQFIQPRSNNSTKVTFVSVKDDKLMTVEEQRSAINQNLTSDDKWNIECCWASTATLKTDSSARNGDEGISAVVGALICLGVFIGVAGIIMIIILLRKRKREAPNKRTVTFNDKPLYIDPEGSPTTPRNVDRAREAREGSFQAQNDEDEEGSDTSSDNYQHANYAFDEETGLSIFQEDQESDYHDFATFLSPPPPPPTVPPPPPPVFDEDETAEANYKNMFQGGHNSYNEEVSTDDEGNTIDEEGDSSSPGSIDSFNYLMSEVARNVEDVDSGYHDYNPERYSMNLQTTEL